MTTTIVTHHWQLEKYSRSRSSPQAAAALPSAPVEWDHYTQPRLALRLEAKYANYPTADSNLVVPDQLLLQVTYDPLYRDRTPQAAQAAAPLLLDSIDLASFSNPDLTHATPKGQLPLKAVYRDAVLGLRYLVAWPATEFRRMQAKFTLTAERERFVDAIRVLVPVKPAAESATATAAAAANPTTQLAANDDAPGTSSSSSSNKKKRKSTGQPPRSTIPFATPQSQSQQNQVAAPGASTRRTKRAKHAATVTASGSGGVGVGGTRLDQIYHHHQQQQQGEYPPPLPPPPRSTLSRPPSFLNAARSSFVDNEVPYYSHQRPGIMQPYQQQQITTTGGGAAASLLRTSGSLASLLPRLAATASKSTTAPTAPVPATTTTATTDHDDAAEEEERFHPRYQTASLALLALEPDQLDKLLQDALLEEGFDQLVGTIKDALGGGGGGA
ncbi:hypothetical protein RHOSPDRAFT_26918 [Rhodotorula sp. JG-1b]|nr:hypothetical protein RHOSPDRAFT_26918 [Rhodotorula sp. JG-1b]